MRVRRLREQLDQIPGALLDLPLPTGASGDEEGVVGSTVHSPDRALSEPDDAFGATPENREDGADDDTFDPVFEWGADREERLANVWMLRAFRTALPGYQVRGKQAALRAFVGTQRDGGHGAMGHD